MRSFLRSPRPALNIGSASDDREHHVNISKSLTKRDAAASSFSKLFSQATPRTDTPLTLPRAPLPQITAAADDVRHPLKQSLDDTQREILLGVHHLTRPSDPNGPPSDELPKTQGDAAKFIRTQYEKYFGALAKAGAHLSPTPAHGRKGARKNGARKGNKGGPKA